MMRRDCQDSVILEQIATKANTLLHVLKQDDVKVSSKRALSMRVSRLIISF